MSNQIWIFNISTFGKRKWNLPQTTVHSHSAIIWLKNYTTLDFLSPVEYPILLYFVEKLDKHTFCRTLISNVFFIIKLVMREGLKCNNSIYLNILGIYSWLYWSFILKGYSKSTIYYSLVDKRVFKKLFEALWELC